MPAMDGERAQRRRERRRSTGSDLTDATVPSVRLARLVRSTAPPAAVVDTAMVIDLGDVRVSVGRDADLGMVAMVLALIGGGR
jgi:hypothetical protein